jgi:hypothetical protein
MALTPIQIFESLAGAWRDGHVRLFGDDGIATADEALEHAKLARITTEANVRTGEGGLARICVGEHVLVWYRGRNPASGEARYVGWHPSRGPLALFLAPASSLEIIEGQ